MYAQLPVNLKDTDHMLDFAKTLGLLVFAIMINQKGVKLILV